MRLVFSVGVSLELKEVELFTSSQCFLQRSNASLSFADAMGVSCLFSGAKVGVLEGGKN